MSLATDFWLYSQFLVSIHQRHSRPGTPASFIHNNWKSSSTLCQSVIWHISPWLISRCAFFVMMPSHELLGDPLLGITIAAGKFYHKAKSTHAPDSSKPPIFSFFQLCLSYAPPRRAPKCWLSSGHLGASAPNSSSSTAPCSRSSFSQFHFWHHRRTASVSFPTDSSGLFLWRTGSWYASGSFFLVPEFFSSTQFTSQYVEFLAVAVQNWHCLHGRPSCWGQHLKCRPGLCSYLWRDANYLNH